MELNTLSLKAVHRRLYTVALLIGKCQKSLAELGHVIPQLEFGSLFTRPLVGMSGPQHLPVSLYWNASLPSLYLPNAGDQLSAC